MSDKAEFINAAIREKRERDNPKPLTWDELREMVGQPIWTIGVSFSDDGSWSMWDIVEEVTDEYVRFGYSTEAPERWSYNLRMANGELCGSAWLAYRYKPKGV